MRAMGAVAALVFMLVLAAGAAGAFFAYQQYGREAAVGVGVGAFLLGLVLAGSTQVAAQWERAVVLRLGRFHRLKGPGLFFVVPVIDTVPYWVDLRVITTSFNAEKTLTMDTVPVDVDAVLFWQVLDPTKAALEVADYRSAINLAAQTALRDVIGKTLLSDMLEGREKISGELRRIIDDRTEPWGVRVNSVEVRDVLIPHGLQDAMSMRAQAERERQARVILGDSERQIAEKFAAAAQTYSNDPTALHLRAMNMLYEGLKNNSTIVVVPSSALDSMQLGGLSGITSMALELDRATKAGREQPPRPTQPQTPPRADQH